MNSIALITAAVLLMCKTYVKNSTEPAQEQRSENSAAETASWHTYKNTKLSFEFRYPDHWTEANARTDKANVIWINFSFSVAGVTRNVLYVKVFPDRQAFLLEERLIAGNATATQVTVDNTTQNLYGDFLSFPTVMISNKDVFIEIGDSSKEGYLQKILTTFRFSSATNPLH